jgi:hypothetical protein
MVFFSFLAMSSSQSPSTDEHSQRAPLAPARTTFIREEDTKQSEPASTLPMTPHLKDELKQSEPQAPTRLKGGCAVSYTRGVPIPITYAYSRHV